MNEKWLINVEWKYFINWNNSGINRDIETRFSRFGYGLNSPFNAYAQYHYYCNSFKTFSSNVY